MRFEVWVLRFWVWSLRFGVNPFSENSGARTQVQGQGVQRYEIWILE
jgi:hypothetical protein